MFTFRHPKPFIQRPVAMQVVARKEQALPDTKLLIVETAPAPALPDAIPENLETPPRD